MKTGVKIVFALAGAGACFVIGPPAVFAQQAPVITLENALARARAESPKFLAAALDAAIAAEDRVQARAAMLPSVSFQDQMIYTQGNGVDPSGVFVGSDGVHVYNSQGVVHADVFAPERKFEYRRASAAEAAAKARQDVALKGIAESVVEDYYAIVSADRHRVAARQSLQDAQAFADITEKLEKGGEVARADTVKARLLLGQRQRENDVAAFESEKARLALAVLIFPDVTQAFSVVDDTANPAAVPALDEITRVARNASPELRAAHNSLLGEEMSVSAAKSAMRPTVSLDYFFGINANRFAASTDGVRNLGSQVQATLNIPIFNGGSLKSKVNQADLKRRQAELESKLVEKELTAEISVLHREAVFARAQIDALKAELDLAAESLRLTLLRYQAGEVSVLEVVDAQNTAFESRRAHDDGVVRYRAVWSTIQIVMGNF